MTSTIARVESEADPHRPGRTGYRIVGPTWASVQDAISTLTNTVDPTSGGATGMARFLGPVSVETPNGWAWAALGEVIVDQQQMEVA